MQLYYIILSILIIFLNVINCDYPNPNDLDQISDRHKAKWTEKILERNIVPASNIDDQNVVDAIDEAVSKFVSFVGEQRLKIKDEKERIRKELFNTLKQNTYP